MLRKRQFLTYCPLVCHHSPPPVVGTNWSACWEREAKLCVSCVMPFHHISFASCPTRFTRFHVKFGWGVFWIRRRRRRRCRFAGQNFTSRCGTKRDEWKKGKAQYYLHEFVAEAEANLSLYSTYMPFAAAAVILAGETRHSTWDDTRHGRLTNGGGVCGSVRTGRARNLEATSSFFANDSIIKRPLDHESQPRHLATTTRPTRRRRKRIFISTWASYCLVFVVTC